MSFHFRAVQPSEFAGKQVKVEKAEILFSDSDSQCEMYVRQLVVYSYEGELAADLIEVKESLKLHEGDSFVLPER
jgi:hypothetical protein